MSSRLITTLISAALCSACVFDASGIAPTATDGTNVTADHPAPDHPTPDHRADGPLLDGKSLDGPPGDTVPGSWWDKAWKRRRRITFDNSKQKSALKSFPALIVLKAGRIDYAATAKNGADLRFVGAGGKVLLSHEIESWNPKGGSFIWVKVTQIDGASKTDHIWLYHGNAKAKDGQKVTSVWSSGYQAVWHLHDDLDDSTSHGLNATNVKSTDTVGKIGRGQRFNGVDQYIDTSYKKDPATWTTSAWIRGAAAPVGTTGSKMAINGALMKEETFQLTWDHHDTDHRGAASLKTTNSNWIATPFGVLKAKTWYLLAATYDGAALRAYLDGKVASQVAASGNPVAQSNSAKIGRHCYRNDVHPFLDGAVDEVRISHVVRSADWLAAQYLSMSDAFTTFGAEEKLP